MGNCFNKVAPNQPAPDWHELFKEIIDNSHTKMYKLFQESKEFQF